MSNPTSNFGWQMPTNTDLVTDLPADFEVFGQAVDTSMADLKGGTTGQILSKTSNTDMDFTWINNDQGDITAVNVTSPITGGGTSGAVTVGIQSASTSQSGAVQLSDSTSTTSSVLAATPTAVKTTYDYAATAYAPAFTNNFYAGKNKIINGNFGVNQRAFSSTTTDNAYTFDRFQVRLVDGTVSASSSTFTPGTAPVTGYEGKNYFTMVSTGQSAATAQLAVQQSIESVRTFANQTVTISFWAKAASATPKIAVEFQQSFGTGGSPSSDVNSYVGQVTLSTSWARYSATFAVPSISGKTIGTNNDDKLVLKLYGSAGSNFNARTGTLGIQSNTFDIWGVQVEAGSTATPFQTATGTIQGELAACQRYYYNFIPTGGSDLNMGIGAMTAAGTLVTNVTFPVTMRTTPTLSATTGTNYYVSESAGNGADTFNSVTITRPTPTSAALYNSTEIAGTAGQATFVRAQNTSAFVSFSAEL